MDLLNVREENRPWGKFREFTFERKSTVKMIFVKTGESLSLQYHAKRSEFWRVVQGTPEITIGEKVVKAKVGDEFFFPIGTNHRISAPDGEVEVLEISIGEFDEKDIVRLEDKYGRS